MRNDAERLRDILEAIDRIEKHTKQGRPAFESSELVQVWTLHHLQIIGEAARAISKTFQEKHSEIPWATIVAMRNILVHQYFNLDLDEVWTAIERDIPELKRNVSAALGTKE